MLGRENKRSREVRSTPRRLLTSCLLLKGRPLLSDNTGRRVDMSRRANKSVPRRDPAAYTDHAQHAERLIGMRAYRLGCRCDNCKLVMRAERARYSQYRRARNEQTTPEQQRRHRLKCLYGITPERYDEMVQQQGGVCAICRKPPSRRRLHIDHDHYTGRVRGLLCNTCNVWLGRIDDDPSRVRNALEYLREDAATQLQMKCFDKAYPKECLPDGSASRPRRGSAKASTTPRRLES